MLDDYINKAALDLKSGKKVYLCPAAMETVIIAKMLQNEHGVSPSGFCDNDAAKQGKNINSLPWLRVFSFDEALRDNNSEFLVVSPHHSAAIIGNLVFERGVRSERILNYHPLERRKTCQFMAHNWIVHENNFVCCCFIGDKPAIDNCDKDPARGVANLDERRKEIIDERVPTPDACVKCYHYKDSYIDCLRRLNSFNLSFRGWCNYKCQYCSASQPNRGSYDDHFFLEEYLEELEKRGMVNDIFSVLYAVGESCLNEKRFGLYRHCGDKRYFLDVFSNCSVFDERLFELAQHSPVIIRSSFDAGTSETYERIKGVTCFEKAKDNVRHYLEAPYFGINLKYLFMPGQNDNERDIDKFVQFCVELNVDFVTPVFSILDDSFDGSKHTQEMFHYLVKRLAEQNIFVAKVDTLYSESYHKLYEKSL